MKSVLIEVNEKRDSFTTYLKVEDNPIYKWTVYHLNQLSSIKDAYRKKGVEVILVSVRA